MVQTMDKVDSQQEEQQGQFAQPQSSDGCQMGCRILKVSR
jgi:hypothetical protein